MWFSIVKKLVILVLGVFLLFVLGVFLMSEVRIVSIVDEMDEKGCLETAGYSFSESINACLREGELDGNQKEAARIAVEYVGWEYATTIIEVQTARCPGCFTVELEKGRDRIRQQIILEDYVVVITN